MNKKYLTNLSIFLIKIYFWVMILFLLMLLVSIYRSVSLSEWLRSETWNLMGSPRAGSNPAADVHFFHLNTLYILTRLINSFYKFKHEIVILNLKIKIQSINKSIKAIYKLLFYRIYKSYIQDISFFKFWSSKTS